MITLPELPRLAWPTTAVRVSNLTGEQADHATAMLARGLAECRPLGLDRVLLTCDSGNEASRRGILANGGIFVGRAGGEDHFWVTLGGRPEVG